VGGGAGGGAGADGAWHQGAGARFWLADPKTQKPTSTARPPLFLGRRSPKAGNQPVTGFGIFKRHLLRSACKCNNKQVKKTRVWMAFGWTRQMYVGVRLLFVQGGGVRGEKK
jgi:hypothetical protein